MLISPARRFLFIHVGKSGGTSVRQALLPFSEEPERFRMRRPPRMNGGKPNPLYTVWETLLLHPKARDVRQEMTPEVFDRLYRFAFVRNPWDWHVSMYHFILREPAMPQHPVVKALGSFPAYLEWAIATPEPYPRGITKFQRDMLTDLDGTLLVNFVGRFETLNRDFAEAARVIGVAATLPHANRSEHRDYRSYYDAHTRKLVADHFAPDVETFGYVFDGASHICRRGPG